MSPCCGQPSKGMERVWQYLHAGESPVEFSSQADAEQHKTSKGGAGRVQQVYRRKR